jgi:hypothetical protein
MGDWASQMVWVLWQSNRNGNWDIYGSFMYNSGIHERAKGEWRKANGGPTILSGASGLKRLASSVLFDAMGRRVVEPKPGVYFVREQTALGSQHSGWSAVGGERSAVRVRKVIVQR